MHDASAGQHEGQNQDTAPTPGRSPTGASIRLVTLLTFAATCLLGAMIVLIVENNRLRSKQKQAGDITARFAYTIQDRLNRSLSAAYALAALIRQGQGRIDRFEQLGTEMISLYGGISSLQLSPDGILRQIVPLAGNEKAIGLNLLTNPQQSGEALRAVTSRKLSLAGPFELVQGGQAVIGRLPVFLNRPDGSEYFWGLVSVTIRIPDFIDAARLRQAVESGYNYELSRILPDTGARQIFARSSGVPLRMPVNHSIDVPNGRWLLSLEPKTGWYSLPPLIAECALVLFINTLLTIMLRTFYKQPIMLRRMVEERTQQLSEANRKLTSEMQERERAEATLRASEARYRILFDNLPLGVTLIDAEHRIIMVNHTHLTWYGRPAGSFVGRHCYEQFEKRDQTCPHCPGVVSMQTGQPAQAESEGIHDDGHHFTVQIRTAPFFDEQGAVLGFIEVIEDITERKKAETERHKLESQMQHAQKLESLGVLAGGIAHDFNNILMSVLGHAELAMLRLSPVSPARENLIQIEQAAQRAADLARQMLAYSGKGRFVVENIDLGELVTEMTHMLEVSISKKVVLRMNLAAKLPPVEVDATQVRQVLMNMVINASEAIGDRSGVITISTGVMECDRGYLSDLWLDEGFPEGMYAYFEVADTGCGMDRHTIGKIFDPFFTTKFTGRGLGMAAVLGIVRGHRGAIKVYSELARGTTFKVLLPAASGYSPPLGSQADEAGIWHGQGTILLVDDEETIRELGETMLKMLGFRVLAAANGRQAVEIFRERQQEIAGVLLDLTMPHMDGEETFRELRRLNPAVRVVISSGYNEQEVSQRFLGKGLAGFIQKPYKLSTLSSVLKGVLSGGDSAM